MRNLLRTLLLLPLLALSLAACDGTFLPTLPSASNPPTVSNVQSAVNTLCQVAVTGTSIAKLLSSNGVVQSANDWAKAICGAVSTAPASDGPTGHEKPKIALNGVRLHGTLPDGRKF